MAESYTTNLGLTEIATGDLVNAWGPVETTNKQIVDNAVAGEISIALPSQSGYPTVALTFVQGSSSAQLPNRRLVFTGTLTADTLVLFPQGRNADFDVQNSTTGNTGTSSTAFYTSTNSSASINVNIANHGLSVGDTYTALTSVTANGVTISGAYRVTGVSDANDFTISASAAATASGTFGNGVNWQLTHVLALGVNNNSGGALGSTVAVPQGATVALYSDGTNVQPDHNAIPGPFAVAGGLTATLQAVSLTSGPAAALMDVTSAGVARVGGIAGAASNPTTQLLSGSGVVATLTTGGGIQVGSPTGGDQGAGTINAASGVFSNGAQVSRLSGEIIAYGGASAPAGWLMCDGSSYSTTSYAALFAVVGYTYGGSGSTFNVPDMRGRVAAGPDNVTNRISTGAPGGFAPGTATIGATAGEGAHTLSQTEMPSHNHAISAVDSGHSHGVNLLTSGSSNFGVQGGTQGGPTGTAETQSASANISASAANTGGGAGHNTVQPTLIVNFIIKT